MKDLVLAEVRGFLAQHFRPGSPILVGVSGGPDSSALVQALYESLRFFPLEVHVAHIDHGWRESSAKEAQELKIRVERLGFPFHLKILNAPREKGNLEERGREARLEFFGEIYRREGCQALLLGHQAEDQAETVLKRVLEGATVMHLGGMQGVSMLQGMVVWRPLLKVSKVKLMEWLDAREIVAFDDVTNRDPAFLRGRMRTTLFPEMRRLFGKELVAPLGQVGHSAQELKEYLERKVAPYLQNVEEGEGEVRLDLRASLPMESVELKTVLRLLCRQRGMSLSFDSVELLCKLLNTKAAKKKILQKNHEFHVDRGLLTVKFLPE